MRRFAAGLAAMPEVLEERAVQLVSICAARAAEEARRLAPVDSGELRANIHHVRIGPAGAAAVSAAPHGAMVEFGTSRMAPRPFMKPAADAVRDEFFAAARAAAGEVLK